MDDFKENKGLIFALLFGGILFLCALVFFTGKNGNGFNLLNFANKFTTGSGKSVVVNGFTALQAPTFSFPQVAYADNIQDDVSIYNSAGEKIEAQMAAKQDAAGGTAIKIINTQQFTPGKYKIEVVQNGKKIEQDFTWGVLAINPNKSIYTPGETAKIAIAVLDGFGKMVCDAKVNLEIKSPSGKVSSLSTDKKSITVNPECYQKKYTEKPDYETNFMVAGEGQYEMTLTAVTENGEYVIKDYFKVQNTVDFDIERVTATRIFPSSAYPVLIKIKANKDFSGQILEKTPKEFQITPSKNVLKYSTIQQGEGAQTIIWNVDFKKGQTINIGYTYKAPEISPQFYLLGPLSLFTGKNNIFIEGRSWQIASDDVSYSTKILSTQGLVCYWRFDEPSGTAADDLRNNCDSSVIVNGPTLGARSLLANDSDAAITFSNALHQYVDGNTTAALNLGDGPFTLEAWVKSNSWSVAATNAIFGKGTNSFLLWVNSSGYLVLSKRFVADIVTSTTPLTTGVAHHVVATKNGSSVHLYIDGRDVTGTVSNQTINNTASSLGIGASLADSGGADWFDGTIDEPAIYNVALDGGTVYSHYYAGTDDYQRKIVSTSGLVGYWRLGETSGSIAYNDKGINNGAYVSGPTLGATGALMHDSNKAVTLNGTSQYITIPDGFDPADGPFSIEWWQKRPSNKGSESKIFDKTGSGAIQITENGSGVIVVNKAGGSAIASAASADSIGAWYHYVVTKDGSSFKIWRNGKDVTGAVTNQTLTTSAGQWVVGANRSTAADFFPATIDEVAFYNTVLTQDQVKDHFKSGNPYAGNVMAISSLIGYWRLNEVSGHFRDVSGNAGDTTIENGSPTYSQTGAISADTDTSIHFTRTTSYGVVPDSVPLQLGDGPFTVEFWAKVDAVDNTEWIFGKWDGGTDKGWAVGKCGTGCGSSNGGLILYNRNSDLSQTAKTWNTVSTPVGDTKWHYYVFTKTAGSDPAFYADGVPLTNIVNNGGTSNTITNNSFQVGISAAGNSTSNSFGGNLDEVAVYNSVLNPAQVKQHYYLGASQDLSVGAGGIRAQGLRIN